MITPDDNGGYARLKKWRQRNPSLARLRQQEYRRKKGGDASCPITTPQSTERPPGLSNADPKVQSSGSAKIKAPEKALVLEGLRELIATEHEKVVDEPVKPVIYRDDYGRVISERQWNVLQERKRSAKDNGYAIDEYSQF